MTRAVLEGVSFGLLDSLSLIRASRVPVHGIRVSGGGASSPLWCQILADVFGQDISTSQVTQGAAYGAALLAGVGTGVFKSVDQACSTTATRQQRTKPGPNGRVYPQYYPQYQELYRVLKEEFKEMAILAETPLKRK